MFQRLYFQKLTLRLKEPRKFIQVLNELLGFWLGFYYLQKARFNPSLVITIQEVNFG